MDWNFIRDITPDILEGLEITLSLFAWSLVFSTIGGLMALRDQAGLAASY